MRGDGRIEADFGGEPRFFRVANGELRKIQEKCDAGPAHIAAAIAPCVQAVRQNPKATILELALAGLGDWMVDYIREPVFQGLLGGGMSPNEAGKLVRTWIDDRGFKGLVENAGLALTLIVAGVDSPEDEEPGEPDAGVMTPTRSREERSTSAGSTEPEPL